MSDSQKGIFFLSRSKLLVLITALISILILDPSLGKLQ